MQATYMYPGMYSTCSHELDRTRLLLENTKATLSKDYGVDMAPGILSVAAFVVGIHVLYRP